MTKQEFTAPHQRQSRKSSARTSVVGKCYITETHAPVDTQRDSISLEPIKRCFPEHVTRVGKARTIQSLLSRKCTKPTLPGGGRLHPCLGFKVSLAAASACAEAAASPEEAPKPAAPREVLEWTPKALNAEDGETGSPLKGDEPLALKSKAAPRPAE